MGRRGARILGLLALLTRAALAEPPRPAPTPEQLTLAREHFEAGRALYQLRNFPDAAREFRAGYELSSRPEFLINLGQAYRMLGRLDDARAQFRRYLDDAPHHAARQRAEELLAMTEREIAAQKKGTPPPPAAPDYTLLPPLPAEAIREPPPPAPPPPQIVYAPPPQLVYAPPPKPRKTGIRKWWWTIPLAAVVTAGLVVGIYFLATDPSVDVSIR